MQCIEGIICRIWKSASYQRIRDHKHRRPLEVALALGVDVAQPVCRLAFKVHRTFVTVYQTVHHSMVQSKGQQILLNSMPGMRKCRLWQVSRWVDRACISQYCCDCCFHGSRCKRPCEFGLSLLRDTSNRKCISFRHVKSTQGCLARTLS